VVALRPDAAARTFVLGEFGRLLPAVDPKRLPNGDVTPDAVYARGEAVVAAADAARRGALPLPADDLDDPWGRGDQTFTRVADEIEETVVPLARLLLPEPRP
jgi:protein-tyrosine phosphatase